MPPWVHNLIQAAVAMPATEFVGAHGIRADDSSADRELRDRWDAIEDSIHQSLSAGIDVPANHMALFAHASH